MRLAFLDSPITRAELAYQRRSIATSRQRSWFWRWVNRLWRILRIIAVIDAIIVLIYEVFAAQFNYNLTPLSPDLQWPVSFALFIIPIVALLPAALIEHFGTQFRTVGFASNSISREKRGDTWELLLLTGIDAKELVRGKVWATVRHVWRGYLLLALLRAGAILWVALEANRLSFNVYPALRFEIRPRYFDPSELHILLTVFFVVIFTFGNMGYTAAFGTLASMFAHSGGVSLMLAIVVRTGVLIASALILGLIGYFVWLIWRGEPGSLPAQVFYFFLATGVTEFDNGALLTIVLAYSYFYTSTSSKKF